MLLSGTTLLPRSLSVDKPHPNFRTITPLSFWDLRQALSSVPVGAFANGELQELTNCSPVLSHADIVRIRDNVLAQYRILYNNYSSMGGSLDARGLVAQYQAVWSAAEGGSYCTYQSDAEIANEAIGYLDGSNTIYRNAVNQYGNNFTTAIAPMRSAYQTLQQAVSSATNDMGPSVNAINAFWHSNFDFHLYQGMSSYLDSLLSEYSSMTSSADRIFSQADSRVQGNFEAEFRSYQGTYSQLLDAQSTWDKVDGFDGYTQFKNFLSPFQAELNILSKFVVVKKPVNDQIFNEIDITFNDIKGKWQAFPDYPQCIASTGIILDSGTSANRFYARQLVLNINAAVGKQFFNTISPKGSLIVTGLSYQHGGAMKPHKQHKDGHDCDLFSDKFKMNAPTFDRQKTIDTIVYLMSIGASRVLYSSNDVVQAANAAYPANPVAYVVSGHDTHLHFEVSQATAQSV